MKRFKRLVISILAAVLAMSFILPLYAGASRVGNVTLVSRGVAIIDFDTGILLFGHNEAVQRVPASMVKMVAAHVVYDAIRDGAATMDTRIQIRPATAALSRDLTYSNVPLESGSSYTVRALLEAVIIRSASAATVALGEGLFGSDRAMIERMNGKAREYNIRASFADSWGLSADNRISPLAMAWMTQRFIREHPEVLEITSRRSMTWGGVTLGNTNHLLGRVDGATGFKTGFTRAAGNCLIGTAERGGRMLITVTMGSASAAGRFDDTEALLEFGFANADRILAGLLPDMPAPDAPDEPDVPDAPDVPDEPDEPDEPDVPDVPDTPAVAGMANPSSATLILDGFEMPLTAYLIAGSHYFKLRDIAYLLNGTDSRFQVRWNSATRSISLVSGLPYTPDGSELELPVAGARPFRPTPSRLYVNGVAHDFEAYLIDGYNYFRLRDLGGILGFQVEWIGATRTVIINTTPPDTIEPPPPAEAEGGAGEAA